MFQSKSLMLISVIARMGMGIIVFIALARILGPIQFGVFASAMAYASLANIISDFGMATYALRCAGIRPDQTSEILWKAISVKMMMTLFLTLCASIVIFYSGFEWEYSSIYLIIYIAMLFASLADLLFVATRANDRFDIEAKVVTVTSLISLIFIISVALYSKDIFYSSISFLFTRLIYLLVSGMALSRWIYTSAWRKVNFRTTWREAKNAFYFAIDNLVTNLSNQIDVVIISLLMSPHSVGIYQAGARLVQGITPFGVMLSQVYLPRLAKAVAEENKIEIGSLSRRLNIEMLVIGLLGFFGFLVLGPIFTRQIYGDAYSELIPLWPGLACFVALRFCASAFGIQLVSIGEIKIRIGSQLAALVSIIILSPALYYTENIIYAPWIITFSSLLIFGIYGLKVVAELGNRALVALMATVSILICCFAVVSSFT